MTSRKVIQIAETDSVLTVLCDDGTILSWDTFNSRWKEWPSVPQPEQKTFSSSLPSGNICSPEDGDPTIRFRGIYRSGVQWSDMFGVKVVDPDGWRFIGLAMDESVTDLLTFVGLFYQSTCNFSGHTDEFKRILKWRDRQ